MVVPHLKLKRLLVPEAVARHEVAPEELLDGAVPERPVETGEAAAEPVRRRLRVHEVVEGEVVPEVRHATPGIARRGNDIVEAEARREEAASPLLADVLGEEREPGHGHVLDVERDRPRHDDVVGDDLDLPGTEVVVRVLEIARGEVPRLDEGRSGTPHRRVPADEPLRAAFGERGPPVHDRPLRPGDIVVQALIRDGVLPLPRHRDRAAGAHELEAGPVGDRVRVDRRLLVRRLRLALEAHHLLLDVQLHGAAAVLDGLVAALLEQEAEDVVGLGVGRIVGAGLQRVRRRRVGRGHLERVEGRRIAGQRVPARHHHGVGVRHGGETRRPGAERGGPRRLRPSQATEDGRPEEGEGAGSGACGQAELPSLAAASLSCRRRVSTLVAKTDSS